MLNKSFTFLKMLEQISMGHFLQGIDMKTCTKIANITKPKNLRKFLF